MSGEAPKQTVGSKRKTAGNKRGGALKQTDNDEPVTLLRNSALGMAPRAILTGFYGSRGERLRHTVHDGALKMPKDSLHLIESISKDTEISVPESYDLPGLDCVVRPCIDPKLQDLVITELSFEKVQVPQQPTPAESEEGENPPDHETQTTMITVERCTIQNRTIHRSAFEKPAAERIRGGGGDEDSKMDVDLPIEADKKPPSNPDQPNGVDDSRIELREQLGYEPTQTPVLVANPLAAAAHINSHPTQMVPGHTNITSKEPMTLETKSSTQKDQFDGKQQAGTVSVDPVISTGAPNQSNNIQSPVDPLANTISTDTKPASVTTEAPVANPVPSSTLDGTNKPPPTPVQGSGADTSFLATQTSGNNPFSATMANHSTPQIPQPKAPPEMNHSIETIGTSVPETKLPPGAVGVQETILEPSVAQVPVMKPEPVTASDPSTKQEPAHTQVPAMKPIPATTKNTKQKKAAPTPTTASEPTTKSAPDANTTVEQKPDETSTPAPASAKKAEIPQPAISMNSEILPAAEGLPAKPAAHWDQHKPGPNDEMVTPADQLTPKPSWYKNDRVADIERAMLPEWFNSSALHRTPKSYIEAREKIISISDTIANRNVTNAMVRRYVVGDAGSLYRLRQFLVNFGLINEDGINDSAPTPAVLRDNKPSVTSKFDEKIQENLIEAVIEQSKKRKFDELSSGDSTFLSIDWEEISVRVGHGATPADCEQNFLNLDLDRILSTTEESLVPSAASAEVTQELPVGVGINIRGEKQNSDIAPDNLKAEMIRNLVESSGEKVIHEVLKTAFQATAGDLKQSQSATLLGLSAAKALEEARKEEAALSLVLSQLVNQRMQKLENRMALLDDIEGVMEAEKVALELERRDLYTARCRHWFGGA